MNSRKVIFDTDPGIDDAMALLFLANAPGIEIVGVTTGFGNGTVETTTRNALYLCDVFGIDAPVAEGAARPLVGDPMPPPTNCHGHDALGDLPTPPHTTRTPHDLPADEFIVRMAHRFPHQITVVTVARLTNLALALRRDPTIAGLIKEVIVMGGAFGRHGHSGNMTPVAETNIHGDPLAADEILGADWLVTLVGLDVTQETIMPAATLAKLGQEGGAAGRFIAEIADFYLAFHRAYDGIDGLFIHDASAVACLIDPSLFVTRSGPVRVVCDGIAVGQTIQSRVGGKRVPPAPWRNRPSQKVCIGVDADRLLDLFYRTIAGG